MFSRSFNVDGTIWWRRRRKVKDWTNYCVASRSFLHYKCSCYMNSYAEARWLSSRGFHGQELYSRHKSLYFIILRKFKFGRANRERLFEYYSFRYRSMLLSYRYQTQIRGSVWHKFSIILDKTKRLKNEICFVHSWCWNEGINTINMNRIWSILSCIWLSLDLWYFSSYVRSQYACRALWSPRSHRFTHFLYDNSWRKSSF